MAVESGITNDSQVERFRKLDAYHISLANVLSDT